MRGLNGLLLAVFVLAMLACANAADSIVDLNATDIYCMSGEKVKVYAECVEDTGGTPAAQIIDLEFFIGTASGYVSELSGPNVDVICNASPQEVDGTENLGPGLYLVQGTCTGCTGKSAETTAFMVVIRKPGGLSIDETGIAAVLCVLAAVLFVVRKKK